MSSDPNNLQNEELLERIQSLPPNDQIMFIQQLGSGSADHLSDEALVNDKVVAMELGVSTITLSIWRSTGRYQLPYAKIGRLVKYRMGDVREFKRSRIVDPRQGDHPEAV